MNAFKSNAGRDEIRRAVRTLYGQCPIPVESQTLNTGEFGETHVLTAGNPEKPPLVLLHGTSSNSASWFGYLAEWIDDFYIYALDIPGQPGLSDENRPLLRDGSMRRWFEAVLTKLGLKTFYLCGMSMGGWMSLDYGLKHSESILGMCLLTTGGLAPFRISFFLKALPLFFLGDPGVRKINRIIHGEVPVHPEVESFTILVAHHFRQLSEKILIFPDDALQGINFPLMYFGGSEDPLLNTRRSAKRLSRLVPEAEIRILEGIAHVILDQSQAIKDFLKGIHTP